MANFIMTNWYIKDKTPYIVIGTAGENNATSISIECDEIIENAEYFLDIGDTKNDIFNTQELTVKQQTTPMGETSYILYLKPMRSFLGKEGVKLLQVRCEYIDNDEKVTKESNIFHAVVNKNTGFSYKFDIAIFQQYLNKVKELAAKVAQDIANLTLGELKDTNIANPTDGQVIKYNAETQKWVNGEGGSGSSLVNVIDSPASGNVGGVVEGATREIENYYYETWDETVTILPNVASGDFSHAEGMSFREGNNNEFIVTASGIASHAEGKKTTASGENSHAEGYETTASSYHSHAEGYYTIASGDGSHAEGYSDGDFGIQTTASGTGSHAEGVSTTASGNYGSHSEGCATKASGDSSHAEGNSTKASGNNSHAEGYKSTASGNYSHAEGQYTNASGNFSHAQNNYTTARGQCQTTIGKYNIIQGTASSITDTDYAFIIGNGTSNNNRSNAFCVDWNGKFTQDNGTTRFKFGNNNGVDGYWDKDNTFHAFGGGGSSLQNVADAVVSGKSGGVLLNDTANNTASGNYATAEGSYTKASGDLSHAEGGETQAKGYCSHAEGYGAENESMEWIVTTAIGTASHAEGSATTARGSDSHSEGRWTIASGNESHAEGLATQALGKCSHSGGDSTIAQGSTQTVIGEYNIAQGTSNTHNTTDYAFIIGNGSDEDNRSNALAIKWDGTFVFADGTEISPAQFAQLKALLN